MNKFTKAAFILPIAMLAIPVSASAAEQQFVDFNKTEDTIHLYNDVRTITFSKPVDPNSLKGITLWNKTANQSVGVVATIGEKNNEVKLSLAEGTAYTNHHAYTLTITGVKEQNLGTLIQPTKYNFKMVASSPTEVPFVSNYVVTNTSGATKTFKLPAGASYVIYDQYGKHNSTARDGVQLTQETNVSLGANDRMAVSFLTTTALANQVGFQVEKSTHAAYTLYKVYKNTSLKISSLDPHSQPDVYFGNPSEKVYVSYAEYTAQNKASDFKYHIEANLSFKSDNIYSDGEMIVTNEDNDIVYVYAPKTVYNLTTVEVTNERAVTALVLNRHEKLKANTTEAQFNTKLDYSVAQGGWQISAVTYDDKGVDDTIFSKQKAAVVRPTGDTIIKNEIGLPITVSGPGRFVTLQKTAEEPLAFYRLNKGEKVKATTQAVEKFNVYIHDAEDIGKYSSIGLYNDTVNDAKLNESVSTSGDDSFPISSSLSTIFENTTTHPIQVYGAAREVQFEAFTTTLVTTMILSPGETVKVNSSPETKVYLKEPNGTGSYSFKKGTYTHNVNFGGFPKVPWIDFSTNEEVTVTNTGDQQITLFTRSGDVTFIK